MAQKATLGQISQFTSMCEEGVYDRAFVQALIEKRVKVTKFDSYRLHVTYAPLSGIAALEPKFSGKDSVCVLFDGRKWERHSSCAVIDQTPGERDFIVAEMPGQFLNKRISNSRDDLAVYFGAKGFRFAIETEAVEFADAQPELQRKNPIYALGSFTLLGHLPSVLRGDEDRCVTVLRMINGKRVLRDGWFGYLVDCDVRLLLVRK